MPGDSQWPASAANQPALPPSVAPIAAPFPSSSAFPQPQQAYAAATPPMFTPSSVPLESFNSPSVAPGPAQQRVDPQDQIQHQSSQQQGHPAASGKSASSELASCCMRGAVNQQSRSAAEFPPSFSVDPVQSSSPSFAYPAMTSYAVHLSPPSFAPPQAQPQQPAFAANTLTPSFPPGAHSQSPPSQPPALPSPPPQQQQQDWDSRDLALPAWALPPS